MKKTTRRIICMLLTMVLTITAMLGTTGVPAMAKGSKKFTVKQYKYEVLSQKGKKGTVALVGVKSKSIKSVTIPKEVKKNGKVYTVVAIGNNAFKNCKKLTSVTTNTQIKKIGNNAFSGCSRLSKINIKTKKLQTVGKNALKGIKKTAVIQVPNEVASAYAKKLKNKGQSKAVTVKLATPQTEAPATEAAPQTEASATEAAPQTEAPATEAAPQTEAPATEAAPQTETPATKTAPQTETPATKTAPQMSIPAQQPQITEPETEAPEVTVQTTKTAQTENQEQTTETTEAESQTQTAEVTEAESQTQTAEVTEAETQEQTTEATETEAQEQTTEATEAENQIQTTETTETEKQEELPWVDIEPEDGMENPTAEDGIRKYKDSWAPHAGQHQTIKVKDVDPTCEGWGKTCYHICTLCGQEFYKLIDMKPLGHEWAETATVDQETGTESIHCNRCGAKKPGTEKKLETEAETQVETTESESQAETMGVTESESQAETTGATESESQTEAAKQQSTPATEPEEEETQGGLPWVDIGPEEGAENPTAEEVIAQYKDSWAPHAGQHQTIKVKDVDPTCEGWGKTCYHICTLCGQEFYELKDMKPLGHAWEETATVDQEATCTKEGKQSIHCTRCNAVKEVTAIPATGHNWDSEITVEPGCNTYGYKKEFCTNEGCNKSKKITLQPLGHDYENGEEVSEPATCLEDGWTSKKCSRCDSISEELKEVIPAAGEHRYGDWIEEKPATCTANGYHYKVCEACGATIGETIKAPGHHELESDEHITTEPTCTERGVVSKRCRKCGEYVFQRYLPLKEHNYNDNGECTNCGAKKGAEKVDDFSGYIWFATYTADKDACEGFDDGRGHTTYEYKTALRGNLKVTVKAPAAKAGYRFAGWEVTGSDGELINDENDRMADVRIDSFKGPKTNTQIIFVKALYERVEAQ